MKRSLAGLGFLCLLAAGCLNPLTRMQMAEEAEKERDLEVPLIREVADVGNLAPLKVQSVGLVTGLDGTGHCPPGYYRNKLEQYLLKSMGLRGGAIINDQQETKVRTILDNPNNALVIVTGYIPAGARRGDTFDIEIELPPGSKTTSLAGGYLELSMLRTYEAARNLSERYQGSSALLEGQIFAQAKGPLIVGFGQNIDSEELKTGRVWLGGTSRLDRPYAFLMKTEEKNSTIRLTNDIATRLNSMFEDDLRSQALLAEKQRHIKQMADVVEQLNQHSKSGGLMQAEMARAASKTTISVRVPFAYRYNHERYLNIAVLTPLYENDPHLLRCRERLRKMLQDPRDTMRACHRLEAMGRESIPFLQEGLNSSNTMVRFCCAESLAYLGSTFGVETLAQIAQESPVYAYHACLALANLGESICRDKLGLLMTSEEPSVRSSAFHALSLLDEDDPRLGGTYLDNTCWLHRLPNSGTPTIYYATSRRPQVILFGRNLTLAADTGLFVGKDFTVVTNKAGDECVITRTTTQGKVQRKCMAQVDQVLLTMLYLRASYPDVVDFLRKASDDRKINCPVVHWVSPEVSLATLIAAEPGVK